MFSALVCLAISLPTCRSSAVGRDISYAASRLESPSLIIATVCVEDISYRGDKYVCAEYYRDWPIVVREIGGRHLFEVYNRRCKLVARFDSAQSAYVWIDEILRFK